jgi:hypothetical protein
MEKAQRGSIRRIQTILEKAQTESFNAKGELERQTQLASWSASVASSSGHESWRRKSSAATLSRAHVGLAHDIWETIWRVVYPANDLVAWLGRRGGTKAEEFEVEFAAESASDAAKAAASLRLLGRATAHAEAGSIATGGDVGGDVSMRSVSYNANVINISGGDAARLEEDLKEIRGLLKNVQESNQDLLQQLMQLPPGVSQVPIEGDSGQLTIRLQPVATARPGEDTTVQLWADIPGREVGAYSIDVFYDHEKLEALEAISHSPGFARSNPNFAPNVVRFVGANVDGIRGHIQLGAIRFWVKPSARGTASLLLSIGELADPTAESLTAFAQSGDVSIEAP